MQSDKTIERPIIGAFNIIRKTARGQFIQTQMVLYTFTTHTLSRTWFVGAITVLHVLFFIAFHGQLYPERALCQLTLSLLVADPRLFYVLPRIFLPNDLFTSSASSCQT